MLLLDDPRGRLAIPRRPGATDPTYTALLDSLSPPALRVHVGMFSRPPLRHEAKACFFQTWAMRDAMQRDLAEMFEMRFEPLPHDPDRAIWFDGEGLHSVVVGLREDHAMRPMPPRTLLAAPAED